MDSLFNKDHNKKIIDRIHTLTPASQAQWGKMNVGQMLAHCQPPLQVAYGELKLKRRLPAILLGSIFRKKLTKDETPFDKGLPTDNKFKMTDAREFEKEKAQLITLIERFEKLGPNGLTKDPHPFFGKMTGREWDMIQWKHLDHHLRQFGA